MIAGPVRSLYPESVQESAMVSAYKIAVALPVLPDNMKSSAILEILRLLKSGLEVTGDV